MGQRKKMNESLLDGLRKNERVSELLKSFSAAFPNVSVYSTPGILQNLFQFQRLDDYFIVLHNAGFNNAPHVHSFFELVYMAAGSAEEYVNDEEVVLEKGDVCIHKPGTAHRITRCGDSDILINILMDKDAFMNTYYAPLVGNPRLNYFFSRFLSADTDPDVSPYIHFQNTPDEVDSLIDLITETYLKNDSFTRIISSGLFLALFGELIRSENLSSRAAEITDYIAANLEDVSLLKTAGHFGYHEKYFSKILLKETGMSFQELLTKIRLTRASSLLSCTDLTVEQIAWEVGYKDVSSLYIRFPKMYGMTPKEYRSMNKY